MVPLPKQYKPLSPYLTLSNEHVDRDTCVHYWTLYYFVQRAIEIDRSSPECTGIVVEKLSHLEELKNQFKDFGQISNELEAQLHLEQYAEKFFSFADAQDRAQVFNKNVIKSFYTAAHLMDVLTIFGELNEKFSEMRKYARWKSVYLSNCMTKGETPIFGPREEITDDGDADVVQTVCPKPAEPPVVVPPAIHVDSKLSPSVKDTEHSLARSEMFSNAQRLCKYAISALEYEDVATAVENLNAALTLLKGSSC